MKTYILDNEIKIFSYGEPIETEGTIKLNRKETFFEDELNVKYTNDKSSFSFKLREEDLVYGFGANLGGINKKGRTYKSYCTDDASHTEDKNALYGAHNFFMIVGDICKGYFIDFPSEILYDVGFTDNSIFSVDIDGKDFEVYVIEGKNPQEIISKFHQIIGTPYIPPKWGFGYFQSRWGYKNENEVLEIYEKFKENEIPIDGIFLDLDYMEDFKDFTVSEERFGNLKELSSNLKSQGVHLVPIIDAGVKIEEGYDIYEEGIKGDHFCKDENGKPYIAAVWPGKVHFPDFMKEDTQRWFGLKYKVLTDLGIEGFWNDMNEPAIFYDETALNDAIESAYLSKGENLDAHTYFKLKDKFTQLSNKDQYYQSFYHELKEGRKKNHDVHNLYGYYMTKSAYLGLETLLEKKRFLLISRASIIGMHKYAGIWTGDNSSWWSHLELNVRMMPSLNMCGFYYTGADTGGFGGECTGELLVRWMQFSIFTPLLRNHSAIGSKVQEPFSFEENTKERSKELIKSRYMLIPYLYSEYMKSISEKRLMFSPLTFEFPDKKLSDIEDQLMLGSIMITPVYFKNKKGRYVTLPQDMLEISFSENNIKTNLKREGIHYMDYSLDELKFYLRKNSMLPYVDPSKNVESMDIETLKVIGYIKDKARYELYDDDGISLDIKEKYCTRINVKYQNTDWVIDVKNTNPNIKEIEFYLYDNEGNLSQRTIKIK